jgi:hypothetical protein
MTGRPQGFVIVLLVAGVIAAIIWGWKKFTANR